MFHECRHIMTNGLRCHAAALRDKPWCYFHARLHRLHNPKTPDSQKFKLPPIEDSSSVLVAIGQVIRALDSPFMDCRRAGLLLYGLQIAAQLTARPNTADPSEFVRSICDAAGGPVDPSSPETADSVDVLAPDTTVCEPSHDCSSCPRSQTCKNCVQPAGSEAEDSPDNSVHPKDRKNKETGAPPSASADDKNRDQKNTQEPEESEAALLRRARAMLAR